MSGEDITNIIISFGLVGWIPIYFLFGGITKVVCALKEAKAKKNYMQQTTLLKKKRRSKNNASFN